mmetsp:Transcript_114172/g.323902  ORF Transcript_114172/g.323902 Transcript_114172/m.323902 type:complete len:114 (+) Transcript_114172:1968-2309(+)
MVSSFVADIVDAIFMVAISMIAISVTDDCMTLLNLAGVVCITIRMLAGVGVVNFSVCVVCASNLLQINRRRQPEPRLCRRLPDQQHDQPQQRHQRQSDQKAHHCARVSCRGTQ